jgi:GABA(A) receptor-associated protein
MCLSRSPTRSLVVANSPCNSVTRYAFSLSLSLYVFLSPVSSVFCASSSFFLLLFDNTPTHTLPLSLSLSLSSSPTNSRVQFPDRVPVIVEREARSALPRLERKKFLAPENVTVAMFMSALRSQMRTLAPEEVIFLFVRGSFVPPPTALMFSVYERYRDEDGLLYATYGGQSTFGGER